jgi:hypothetical protein
MRHRCVYDPPGVGKSTGIPSEGAMYDTIDAVYKEIAKKNYESENIWLSGGECTSNCPPAYLMARLRDLGEHVNFVHDKGV